MNIGTHQYPQLQPLLFRLPDSAGRAQAGLKLRGQGTEVSGDKYAKEELLVPFTCLGVEPSSASSLESRCADSFALALVAQLTSTSAVTPMLLGWPGSCQAPKNKCGGSSLPPQPWLHSHGWGASRSM